jgi:hypothetical protein
LVIHQCSISSSDQAESRKKEKELTELARERRRIGKQREFENLLAIVQSGRAYTFEKFSAPLSRVQKPFTLELDNCNITVTESDATIMLEESTRRAVREMHFRKKRQGNNDNDGEREPTRKRR